MQAVDSYIAQFSPEVQQRLLVIRDFVWQWFSCHGVCGEKIYHSIPTLMLDGREVFNYGAYRDFITLYIGYAPAEALKTEYPQLWFSKAAVRIPHNSPLPPGLLDTVCETIWKNMK